jgi:hypothetical protein
MPSSQRHSDANTKRLAGIPRMKFLEISEERLKNETDIARTLAETRKHSSNVYYDMKIKQAEERLRYTLLRNTDRQLEDGAHILFKQEYGQINEKRARELTSIAVQCYVKLVTLNKQHVDRVGGNDKRIGNGSR